MPVNYLGVLIPSPSPECPPHFLWQCVQSSHQFHHAHCQFHQLCTDHLMEWSLLHLKVIKQKKKTILKDDPLFIVPQIS